MAKQLSTVIKVTANTADLDLKLKQTEAKLNNFENKVEDSVDSSAAKMGQLNKAVSGMAVDTKGIQKPFEALDKQIQKQIANLYKLKAELKKETQLGAIKGGVGHNGIVVPNGAGLKGNNTQSGTGTGKPQVIPNLATSSNVQKIGSEIAAGIGAIMAKVGASSAVGSAVAGGIAGGIAAASSKADSSIKKGIVEKYASISESYKSPTKKGYKTGEMMAQLDSYNRYKKSQKHIGNIRDNMFADSSIGINNNMSEWLYMSLSKRQGIREALMQKRHDQAGLIDWPLKLPRDDAFSYYPESKEDMSRSVPYSSATEQRKGFNSQRDYEKDFERVRRNERKRKAYNAGRWVGYKKAKLGRALSNIGIASDKDILEASYEDILDRDGKTILDENTGRNKQRKVWNKTGRTEKDYLSFLGGPAINKLSNKILGRELIPEHLQNARFGGSKFGGSIGNAGFLLAGGLAAINTAGSYTDENAKIRDTGISNSGFFGGSGVGNALDVAGTLAKSLPLIGGVVDGLEKSLLSITGFSRGLEKATEVNKALTDSGKRLADTISSIKAIRSQQDIARLEGNASWNQLTMGGKSAEIQAIKDEQAIKLAQLKEEERLAQEEANKKKREADQAFVDPSKKLKSDLGSWYWTDGGRKEDETQLKGLNFARNAEKKKIDEEMNEKAKKRQIEIDKINKEAQFKQDVLEGKATDTKGVGDSFQNINSTLKNGFAVDEIDAMRKAFKALNPTADDIGKFETKLTEFAAKTKELEGKQIIKGIDEQLKDFGKTAEEIQIGKMILGGDTLEQATAKLERLKESTKIVEGKTLFKQLKEDMEDWGKTAKELEIEKLLAGGASKSEVDSLLGARDRGQAIAGAKDFADQTKYAGMNEQEKLLAKLVEFGAPQKEIDNLKQAINQSEMNEGLAEFKKERKENEKKLKTEIFGTDLDKKAAELNQRNNLTTQQKQALLNDESRISIQQRINTAKGNTKEGQKELALNNLKELSGVIKSGKDINGNAISDDVKKEMIKNAISGFNALKPTTNGDLLAANRSNIQRVALQGMAGVKDQRNPELSELQQISRLLEQIKEGKTLTLG